MKDCSTFVAFFALVSKNGIPRESANSCEARNSKQWAHTPTHSSPGFLVHLPELPDPHPNPVWLVPKHLAGHWAACIYGTPASAYRAASLHWTPLHLWPSLAPSQAPRVSANIPLLLYSLLLSLWSDHICSPPTTCWRFHWHSGLSPAATVLHYWKTPRRQESCEQGPSPRGKLGTIQQ